MTAVMVMVFPSRTTVSGTDSPTAYSAAASGAASSGASISSASHAQAASATSNSTRGCYRNVSCVLATWYPDRVRVRTFGSSTRTLMWRKLPSCFRLFDV